MAKEHYFDITAKLDMMEMKNAVVMAEKEVATRFDFKGLTTEINLEQDSLTLVTASEQKLQSLNDIIVSKLVKRGLSPLILDPQKAEDAFSGNVRQKFLLRQSLKQEDAKEISKKIRDNFPKTKPSIQGDAIRVKSKSKDELQAIIENLKKDSSIKIPLQFTNYR